MQVDSEENVTSVRDKAEIGHFRSIPLLPAIDNIK